jgi:hypothetical protein
MGGSPATIPAKPDFSVDALKVGLEGEQGRARLAQEMKQLGYAANAPLETFTPDVWGPSGLQTQAAQIAAINAFASKKNEQETNPSVAAIRERLPKMIEEDLSEDAWKKRMQSWAKDAGITLGVKTGLGDSTVARSALFDASTEEGDRIRKERKAEAAQFLASNPLQNVGLDAGSLLSANQSALQNAMTQRNSFRDAMFGRVGQANQATSDWLNKMGDTMSRASDSYKQSWDNYAQGMAKAAEQKAAARSKMIGTVAQIGGTALGSMVGMPMLGSVVGGLVGAAAGTGGAELMNAMGATRGGSGGEGGGGGRYGGLADDFSSLKQKFSGEKPWFPWSQKS